jgi:hypothetical protein
MRYNQLNMLPAITRVLFVVFGAVASITFFSMPYFNRLEAVKNKAEVKINDQIIIAEVAHEEEARTLGLSGRKSLNINEGMLFIFEDPGIYPFWMKDMNFPIDIIWIDSDNQIVKINENVLPEPGVPDESLTQYKPPIPVERVLELRGGRARLLNAEIGDLIKARPLVNSQKLKGL